MSPTFLKAALAPLAGALAGLALPIGTTHAQDKIDYFVECDGGLLDAAGVIGPRHDYEINGECTLWRMVQPEDTDEMQALLDAGVTWRHDAALVTFKTRGRASWDRESAVVKESLTFEGPVTGKSTAQGTCIKDPFLAAVACSGFTRQTSLDAGPHLVRVQTYFARTRHLAFGNKFTVDEAQALSALHAKTKGPPPPEPKNPPLVDLVALRYIVIGREEHVVRLTLRGAQPITASLSRGRETPRGIVIEDPRPGPIQRSAAIRIPPSAALTPGVLTIALGNKHGNARFELLACSRGGSGNPRGCPVPAKAGTRPPTTVTQPAAPVALPGGRTR